MTDPKKTHIYNVGKFFVFPSSSINDFNEDSGKYLKHFIHKYNLLLLNIFRLHIGSMECFDDDKYLSSCSITDFPEHNSEVKISMFNVLQFTINQMILLMAKFN